MYEVPLIFQNILSLKYLSRLKIEKGVKQIAKTILKKFKCNNNSTSKVVVAVSNRVYYL